MTSKLLVIFILEENHIIVEQVIDLVAVICLEIVIYRHPVQIMIPLWLRGTDVPFNDVLPVFQFEVSLGIVLPRISPRGQPAVEPGIDDDHFILEGIVHDPDRIFVGSGFSRIGNRFVLRAAGKQEHESKHYVNKIFHVFLFT
jgi:hypothetical protein